MKITMWVLFLGCHPDRSDAIINEGSRIFLVVIPTDGFGQSGGTCCS